MDNLDEFGKIFINEVRDKSIEEMQKRIDGSMKGESAKLVQEKVDKFNYEQKEFLKYILSLTVNNTLHNFLWMIEQYDELKLLYNDTDIREESDGLTGELYTEDGWIEKYTKYK